MQVHSILDFLQFSNPTSEQVDTLKKLQYFTSALSTEKAFVLCGAAGTGKTSITNAFVGYLNAVNKDYCIAAPTGRAARIISKKANVLAKTIHSLIYDTTTNELTGDVVCTLKNEKFDNAQVFIIDEASMIPSKNGSSNGRFISNASLLHDLVTFIKDSHTENKVVFLGDTYQLAPINELQSNALSTEYLSSQFGWSCIESKLTEVKRQSDGSEILHIATNIRKDIDSKKSTNQLGKIETFNIERVVNEYLKDVNSFGYGSSQAIAVSHFDNATFNNAVRQKQHGHTAQVIKKGDLLMIQSNWCRGEFKLFNGDHVEVVDVDMSQMESVAGMHFIPITVRTIDENKIEIQDYLMLDTFRYKGGAIPYEVLKNLIAERMAKNPIFRSNKFPWDDRYIGAMRALYGHSITCNKAQGGEWSKIYIKGGYIPSLNWSYTAVTRAVENVKMYA
jgi:exodeoxyribonuclease V